MELTKKAPLHLWVIGGVSLLWNLGGVASYLATELGQLEGMAFPPDQVAYFYSFPAWAVAFWALGVWGSAIGSLLLLLRKKMAVLSFGISIIGLLGAGLYQKLEILTHVGLPRLTDADSRWQTTGVCHGYSHSDGF